MKKEKQEVVLFSKDINSLPKELDKLIFHLKTFKNNHQNNQNLLKFRSFIEHDGYDNSCTFEIYYVKEESDNEFKNRVEASNKNITKCNNQLFKNYLDAKKLYAKIPGITVNKPQMKKLHN